MLLADRRTVEYGDMYLLVWISWICRLGHVLLLVVHPVPWLWVCAFEDFIWSCLTATLLCRTSLLKSERKRDNSVYGVTVFLRPVRGKRFEYRLEGSKSKSSHPTESKANVGKRPSLTLVSIGASSLNTWPLSKFSFILGVALSLFFSSSHKTTILHIHSGLRLLQWQVLEGKLEERGEL